MKLKDLKIGETFKLGSGENGKIYRKETDNDNLVFVWCKCLTDLNPDIRRGLMIDAGHHDFRFDKELDIFKIEDI